jgi:hypothetical protein
MFIHDPKLNSFSSVSLVLTLVEVPVHRLCPSRLPDACNIHTHTSVQNVMIPMFPGRTRHALSHMSMCTFLHTCDLNFFLRLASGVEL